MISICPIIIQSALFSDFGLIVYELNEGINFLVGDCDGPQYNFSHHIFVDGGDDFYFLLKFLLIFFFDEKISFLTRSKGIGEGMALNQLSKVFFESCCLDKVVAIFSGGDGDCVDRLIGFCQVEFMLLILGDYFFEGVCSGWDGETMADLSVTGYKN